MYEEDLQILDKQIAKYKKLIKSCKSDTAIYEYKYKLNMLQEMRLDVLIQIKHFEGQE
jgi:hypothetical protein